MTMNWVVVFIALIRVSLANGLNRTIVGNLPTLFLLGPMKSGSSSLHHFLVLHSHICSGSVKESHFFSQEFYKGKDHYMRLFTNPKCSDWRNSNKYHTDGSPMFHLMKQIGPKFKQIYNNELMKKLKFIVTLREPVARSYSYYQFFERIGLAHNKDFSKVKTFQEQDASGENYRGSSLYYRLLVEFEKYFQRNQILVLSFHDLLNQQRRSMKRIATFLNISYTEKWDGAMPNIDHMDHDMFRGKVECVKRFVPKFECAFRDELGRYFEPHNKNLYNYLNNSANSSKHRAEPVFPSFPSLREVACVNDSRGRYDKLLKQVSPKTHC